MNSSTGRFPSPVKMRRGRIRGIHALRQAEALRSAAIESVDLERDALARLERRAFALADRSAGIRGLW